MKLQIASDLHLEFYGGDFYDDNIETEFYKMLDPMQGADILILAGDIGYPEKNLTKEFIAWCCLHWPQVVWIYGNHEYYNSSSYFYRRDISDTIEDKEKMAEEYRATFKNLTILLTESATLEAFPNYRIIGTTLWTRVPEKEKQTVSLYMNDFREIVVADGEVFKLTHWSALHEKQYNFIEQELEEAKKNNQKAIVLTHHLPTYKMCLPQYRNSNMNSAFMTDADELLEHPSVAVWICGHSHGQKAIEIQKRNGEITQCIMNARGYPKEGSQQTYSAKRVIYV
jgi:predicted phosphodiesterase